VVGFRRARRRRAGDVWWVELDRVKMCVWVVTEFGVVVRRTHRHVCGVEFCGPVREE
jgi:hypothetical protein